MHVCMYVCIWMDAWVGLNYDHIYIYMQLLIIVPILACNCYTFPSLNIGVGKASLQQFESEIQQNPNAVWCIWIPQPVRITLPACQGCHDFVL